MGEEIREVVAEDIDEFGILNGAFQDFEGRIGTLTVSMYVVENLGSKRFELFVA